MVSVESMDFILFLPADYYCYVLSIAHASLFFNLISSNYVNFLEFFQVIVR